jgi:hypothetical protein
MSVDDDGEEYTTEQEVMDEQWEGFETVAHSGSGARP